MLDTVVKPTLLYFIISLRTGVHVCCRWTSESPEPLQQPSASQEEAKVSHSVHQPPDLRAREAIPLPEVFVACRPG